MYFSSDQGDTFSQALLPSASTEQVRMKKFHFFVLVIISVDCQNTITPKKNLLANKIRAGERQKCVQAKQKR